MRVGERVRAGKSRDRGGLRGVGGLVWWGSCVRLGLGYCGLVDIVWLGNGIGILVWYAGMLGGLDTWQFLGDMGGTD